MLLIFIGDKRKLKPFFINSGFCTFYLAVLGTNTIVLELAKTFHQLLLDSVGTTKVVRLNGNKGLRVGIRKSGFYSVSEYKNHKNYIFMFHIFIIVVG